MTEHDYGKIISKNLKNLAYNAGKTQTDICNDLKLSRPTLSSWMNGTRVPRMDKIDMLCEYFKVPRQAIMEEHTDDVYYLDQESREIAEFLHKNPQYRVLFNASRKVKPEDIEFVKQMIDRLTD